MRTITLTLVVFFLSLSMLLAQDDAEPFGFEGRPLVENIWSHSAHTLNKGEFIIGIGPIAYGISDRIQFETNLLFFILQYYNLNLKAELYNSPTMSIAAGYRFGYLNLPGTADGDTEFMENSPFLTFTFPVSEKTELSAAGQVSFYTLGDDIQEVEPYVAYLTNSGSFLHGAINTDLSKKTKLLVEAGYNFTFEGPRLGAAVNWGWQKFRLKLGLGAFNPKQGPFVVLPVIGLWWRFDA